MARYHMNSRGEAAPCVATIRDCPIGGTHGSREELAHHLMAQEVNPNPSSNYELVPVGKYEGKSIEDVVADRRYASWILHRTNFNKTHPNFYKAVKREYGKNNLRRDFEATTGEIL